MAFETTKKINFQLGVSGDEKLRSAMASVGGAMRGMNREVGAAAKFMASLTGVVSVGAFANMVNDTIEAKAKLYDLGLQTGISVEALAGLRLVAKYSSTALEEIAGASNKLSKALATNNEDSKGAAQAIKALGLEYNTFKALGADEQLLAVARAMEGFGDGTGKTAAAMLLFGKTGATLLPFLKELAERGIMATRETTASALAAKQYGDNLVALREAGEEWQRSVVSDMLPTLTQLTSRLAEAKSGSERLAVAFGYLRDNNHFSELDLQRKSLERLNLSIAVTSSLYDNMLAAQASEPYNRAYGQRVTELRTQLDLLRRSTADASEALKANANLLTGVGAAGGGRGFVNPAGVTLPQVNIKTPGDDGAAAQAKKFMAEQLKIAQDASNARRALYQAEEAAILDFERAEDSRRNKEVRAAQDAVKAAQFEFDTYGLLRSEIEALGIVRLRDKQLAFFVGSENFNAVQREIEAQQDLVSILQRGEARDKAALDKYRNDPAAGAGRAVKAYLEDVQAAGLATERVVGDAVRGLEDGLTQLFTKGKFDARSFIDTLISEFIRLRVVKPLLADILGGSGGFLSSLFGGGGGGLASIGNMGAAFLIPGMATGGPVSSGSPYVVGERGPELFVPRTAGVIVPNGAGGGQRIVVQQSITNHIDSRSDRAQVGQVVAAGVREGNQQLLALLHARGVT